MKTDYEKLMKINYEKLLIFYLPFTEGRGEVLSPSERGLGGVHPTTTIIKTTYISFLIFISIKPHFVSTSSRITPPSINIEK
jgi:hypothetical protein